MVSRAPLAFSVTADTGRFERSVGMLTKSVVPRAAAYEVNASLFRARDALRDTAKEVLDRPTDYS